MATYVMFFNYENGNPLRHEKVWARNFNSAIKRAKDAYAEIKTDEGFSNNGLLLCAYKEGEAIPFRIEEIY